MAIRRRRRRPTRKPEAPKLEDQHIYLEDVPLPQAMAALEALNGNMDGPLAHMPDDHPFHAFHTALVKQIEAASEQYERDVAVYAEELADWEDEREAQARSKRRREERAAMEAEADEAADWLRGVWKGEIECEDASKVLAAQALAMPYLADR